MKGKCMYVDLYVCTRHAHTFICLMRMYFCVLCMSTYRMYLYVYACVIYVCFLTLHECMTENDF